MLWINQWNSPLLLAISIFFYLRKIPKLPSCGSYTKMHTIQEAHLSTLHYLTISWTALQRLIVCYILKGVLTQKFWPCVFLLQCVAGGLLVKTRHIVCCSARQIIYYRLLITDQFQFQFPKRQASGCNLSPPRGCSARSRQHTELWRNSARFASSR